MVLQFSKLGKGVKDLLKKKYDYNGLTIKTSNKSSAGNITLESEGKIKNNSVQGHTKAEYAESNMKATVQLSTSDKDADTNAEVVLKKLADGLEVTIGSNAVPDFSAKATYGNKSLAAELGLTKAASGAFGASVAATVAAGANATAGANVALSLDGSPSVSSWNIGAQYDTRDLSATLLVANASSADVRFLHKSLLNNTHVGVQVSTAFSGDNLKFNLGLQHELDANTTLKAKYGNCGTLHTVVEHRLASPNLTLGLASSYKASSAGLTASAMGLNLSLGN